MADASRDIPPPGWGDAFASLPLQAPPASRWPAIEAALDAGHGDGRHAGRTHATTAWPRRLAWAAALATIALPAALWLRPGDVAPAPTPVVTAPASPRPAAPVVATVPAPPPAPVTIAAPPPAAPVATPPLQSADNRIARAPTRATPRPAPQAQAKPWPRARMATGSGEGESLQAAFEPYYMESARLERMIAATRDPRVGSGPGASLAGALDAELAAVDARLTQPGLDANQRLALWRERVDVLRASAELESQLRLLAAEGDALDGALLRVD